MTCQVVGECELDPINYSFSTSYLCSSHTALTSGAEKHTLLTIGLSTGSDPLPEWGREAS